MKVRVLYFEGCPNHPPATVMARRVVAEHGLNADVEGIEVSPDDVVRYRFLGSPTIQVDGVDIEPAARERMDFAMSCRVYDTPDGLPSEGMLLAALGVATELARAPSVDRTGSLAVGGSLLTAALSSACCWLPLLLLAFGTSAAGVSAFFERWRPAFIIVAVASLALGFYVTYSRRAACVEGCCVRQRRRPRRIQHMALWGSAVAVASFIFFPGYVGFLIDGDGASAAAVGDVDAHEYVFDIEGMHCEGCAAVLRAELVKIDGVHEVQVDYESRTARLVATGGEIESRVRDTASRVGYTANARGGR